MDRVSVVNFCSNAADMLWLSSMSALANDPLDFDYILVLWGASPEVQGVATSLRAKLPDQVRLVDYQPSESIGFVPNLRRMMNVGFDEGFRLNEYAGIINTDCYLGPLWLTNLARRVEPGVCVNSQHITPIQGQHVISMDLGVPERGKFNVSGFYRVWRTVSADCVETEEERGGWRNTNTMPYLFHRQWWEKCGPWDLEVGEHRDPPDRRFFQRCHDAGMRFVMAMDSVAYHHEAVERRSSRPRGAEEMPEGR